MVAIQKKSLKTFIIALVIIALVLVGFNIMKNDKPQTSAGNTVTLSTTLGEIVIQLEPDMLITAGNFKSLVEKKFYDGVIFHRVIPGFMIQGGDPKGTGIGGPGYTIKDEFGASSNLRGTISMANAGPNTGGSQFFINTADNTFLDGKHPVFGKVVKGMDVVDKISNVQRDRNDKPLQEVKIISARLS